MNEPPIGISSITQADRIQNAVRLWGDRLRISLAEARAKLSQSGDRGDVNEAAVREFLREHLPPKYRIGQGEVIDAAGRLSRQVDVVVADEEQPFRVDDAVRFDDHRGCRCSSRGQDHFDNDRIAGLSRKRKSLQVA